ncbi:alpha/beta hydrolase [Streptomyces oceani]|uniref:Proteinase n=1 Tax=Streptomyces oceani TaxID=1075402 RepID=A0A1E7JW04_9ACTN|nr:alpha/beta hydrolase [Streptomyces oceani]OEU95483.1 proteinase [Streptomyces oceani]
MRTRRPLRTASALLVAAVLLVSGCSSGGEGDEDGTETSDSAVPSPTRSPGGDAEPLKALPTKIPSELRPYYEQRLEWSECDVIGFECAKLRVPLDYDDPREGEELRLAVSRKKSSGSGKDKRIGSLLVNPGGPGGSAIKFLQEAAAVSFPPQLRERYDMVGMDPRGVGRSEPVECLSDREMDEYVRTDQTPDDSKEVDQLVEAYKGFAKGCEQRSSGLLGHVSTVDSARDMDVLRAVLGDEKLHYYGASYGTFLGSTYAGLYPQRVGRLVLDAAMDPSLTSREVNVQQAGGFATAFKAFAKDCVGQSDCPLGDEGVKDAGKKLRAFFEKLDRKPMKTGTDRTLTESMATTGVIQAMYSEQLWPQLRQALTAGMKKGKGGELLALADQYYERDTDGSYANIMFANPAVNCLDLPPAFDGPKEARKAVDDFEETSPVFGRGFAWSALNCTYWQQDATGEPHSIAAKGSEPVVVIGTTRDPATPYAWAQGLAGQLSKGRLLTYEADGHSAFLRGSRCVDESVLAYLLKGKAPKDGKRCSPGMT